MNEKMIQVTQEDMEKLMALLASRLKSPTRDREHLEMLAQELDRAEIVRSRDIPADTVTMHSHVLVRDLDTGGESTYTLVFPSEADIAKGKISILAPIATALLGYREGDEVEWPTPGGRRRLNVIQVLYQPEAAGDEPGYSVAIRRDSEKVEQFQLQALCPLEPQERRKTDVTTEIMERAQEQRSAVEQPRPSGRRFIFSRITMKEEQTHDQHRIRR